MKQDKFSYPSKQAVADDARRRNLPLPWSERTELLAEPCELSGISLRNRLLAQPIEGFDANPDGSPSDRTVRRYCELARGGSGALWLESVSVNHQGRSNPMQLWITEANADTFKSLVSAIRESAPGKIYLVLQLTHSGRNSNPDGTPTPICAFHSHAIPKENETIITDEALEALEEDYVRAALLAEQAGFDAVDIRACHGYLINELFAAVNRPGRYGGSFENRTRLLMNIVDRVQRVSRVTVGVRINMYDGIPYPDGWGLIRALEDQGISVAGKRVVMLGAGGVASSIAYNLSINRASSVDVVNLFPEQAEALCQKFGEGFTPYPLSYPVLAERCKGADLFINASVMGQLGYDEFQTFDFLDNMAPGAAVFDVNYSNPNSKLVPTALVKGMPAFKGRRMTACQGIRAISIWTGREPSRQATEALIADFEAMDQGVQEK